MSEVEDSKENDMETMTVDSSIMNGTALGLGRVVGGGLRMGNTCTPVADSC